MLDVHTLGFFGISNEAGDSVAPKPAKPRQVLALLALDCGNMLQLPVLVEELWGEQPPRSAPAILQNYVMQLRKFLSAQTGGSPDSVRDLLRTYFGGYMLNAGRGQVDAFRFEAGLARGRRLLEQCRYEPAAEVLSESLGLWKGPALADVQRGPLLTLEVMRLDELRLDAQQLRIEADMRLGRHGQVIGELQALITKHPCHEALYEQLMISLYHSGRRMHALEVYRKVYQLFDEKFGLEPSGALRSLQQDMLAAAPNSVADGAGRSLDPALRADR